MIQLVLLCVLLHFNINVSAEDGDGLEPHNIQPRLVGGDLTKIESVPYVVSIQSGEIYFATGSLLSSRHVITTASAFYGMKKLYYSVRFKSSYILRGGTLFPVKKLIQHPKFSYVTGNNDFLIMILAKSIKLTRFTDTLRLPKRGSKSKPDELFIVSGWGYPDIKAESNVHLRSQLLPLADHETCKKAYAPYRAVTSKMLCVGGVVKNKGPCYGDSGAPVVFRKNALVCVISFSRGCGLKKYPAVCSSAIAALNWITNTVYRNIKRQCVKCK